MYCTLCLEVATRTSRPAASIRRSSLAASNGMARERSVRATFSCMTNLQCCRGHQPLRRFARGLFGAKCEPREGFWVAVDLSALICTAISMIRIRYIMEYIYIKSDQLFSSNSSHRTFVPRSLPGRPSHVARLSTATVHGVVFRFLNPADASESRYCREDVRLQ